MNIKLQIYFKNIIFNKNFKKINNIQELKDQISEEVVTRTSDKKTIKNNYRFFLDLEYVRLSLSSLSLDEVLFSEDVGEKKIFVFDENDEFTISEVKIERSIKTEKEKLIELEELQKKRKIEKEHSKKENEQSEKHVDEKNEMELLENMKINEDKEILKENENEKLEKIELPLKEHKRKKKTISFMKNIDFVGELNQSEDLVVIQSKSDDKIEDVIKENIILEEKEKEIESDYNVSIVTDKEIEKKDSCVVINKEINENKQSEEEPNTDDIKFEFTIDHLQKLNKL